MMKKRKQMQQPRRRRRINLTRPALNNRRFSRISANAVLVSRDPEETPQQQKPTNPCAYNLRVDSLIVIADRVGE